MSTGAITTSGLGSGVDIEAIIEKMTEIEQRPVQMLSNQKTIYQGRISAYEIVEASVKSLDLALGALLDPGKFDAKSGTVSNSSVASLVTGKSAEIGTHKLDVHQLAEAQKVVTAAGFDEADTVVGTGKVKISLGSYDADADAFTATKSLTIDINSGNNTLSGIRDSINAANAGVTASIVNDGKGNRLVLTGTTTGEKNAFTVDVSDATDRLGELNYTPVTTGTSSMSLLETAQDAKFSIDGIEMVSGTNTAGAAIKGLSITLQGTGKTNITVASTTESLKDSITKFIDAYNELNTVYRESTKYDKDTDTAGALNGETSMRSFMEQIRRTISASATNIPGGATTFTQIGISVQKDGSLKVDDTKLDAALADPKMNVSALFKSTGTATTKGVTFISAATTVKEGKYNYDLKRDSAGNITGTINGSAVKINGNQVSAGGITLLFEEGQTALTGSVYYSNGIIGKMRSTVDAATSMTSGALGKRVDSLKKMIEDVDTRMATHNGRIAVRMNRLRMQLNTMDTLMARMDSLSKFLSQKLGTPSSSNSK